MSGPEGAQRGPRVSALYRYPVKGLSPEPLARASLIAGDALPFDRAYAIENGSGRFDPAARAMWASTRSPITSQAPKSYAARTCQGLSFRLAQSGSALK